MASAGVLTSCRVCCPRASRVDDSAVCGRLAAGCRAAKEQVHSFQIGQQRHAPTVLQCRTALPLQRAREEEEAGSTIPQRKHPDADAAASATSSGLAMVAAVAVTSAAALLGAGAAQASELVAGAAAIASLAADAAVQDACAQELGVSDLNTVIVVACVLEFLALTGAAVGGYIARMRKQEVEKINAQLRQININLRKQARVESYAPALSYAPVGSPAAAAAAAASASASATLQQAEEEASPVSASVAVAVAPRKEEVLRLLRAGKRQLRSANPAAAEEEFKKALAVAQEIEDVVEEKKAARGAGASLQRQRKFRDAIKYHSLVLERSEACGEHSGDTEAYGAIADCYTELGDLEEAAKYYDKYILRLEDED